MIELKKQHPATSRLVPLEQVRLQSDAIGARRLIVKDGMGRVYVDRKIKPRQWVRFVIRGAAGRQHIAVTDAEGGVLEERWIELSPRTGLTCDRGPYAELLRRLRQMIEQEAESKSWVINGRSYYMPVCWSRDLVYTLKAAKYFIADVRSGLDYWMESQLPSGMFWDCIYENGEAPAPTWFGEALGKGWFKYDEGMKYIVRRVPVLADTEYVFTEGVWYAWKAGGDDAWMRSQLPRLEKALTYMTSDPLRWSEKFGLVRRSFTADEWDFANPHYCAGDHRCIHRGDPTFLFHGNQSGLYAMYWRMAEMYEHLGDSERARQLREDGEALRSRANRKLFFGNVYGHMIPETLDPRKVYARVGDERERMSLSTGYTINRKLPTHDMAVKILREYQRRGKLHRKTSFAEWWTMDPPYRPDQWPGQQSHAAGCPEGEYMNGGICTIIAGEIAKAAFDHGFENYGVDILDRVWRLCRRDGGHLHQVYKRLPENPKLPKTTFRHVDLRSHANRSLKRGSYPHVPAWTDEGDNDMRNLPVGKGRFGAIEFDVIDPAKNDGRAMLYLKPGSCDVPTAANIDVAHLRGRSVYFLHAMAHSISGGAVAGIYDVTYDDGCVERIYLRHGQEINLWWGTSDRAVNRAMARRAWWGGNPTWKNVGLYMFGWNNPHPDKAITAIRAEAVGTGGRGGSGGGSGGGIMLGGISVSDQPVAFEAEIRSYGLPDCWAHAAVYHAIAEGLAGIEDAGVAFSTARVSPRWAAAATARADATLHYPASGGYCAYAYRLDRRRKKITLDLTGAFTQAHVHCLLPGRRVRRVLVDGREHAFEIVRVERSVYADFNIVGLPRRPIVIEYDR
ncbi:MAG: hypothetical protein WC058_00380 [Phycisphaeraceae bacterium]